MELATADYDEQYDSEVLPDGTELLDGQYVIERYLSSGGFGITYYARDSLDRRVVIKECFPEAYCSRKNRTVLARSQSHQGEFKSIVDMFVREAYSIAKLSHPNIVGVHQVFQANDTAYMALDLIDGKDLLDIIEASDSRPKYEEVNAILLKVLDAIATVHDQDMLHRDISPDNILIDAWDNPVLIDFGAAREEASKKSRALSAVLVVKDGYSPQEFYIAGSLQTPCSDLYALAATFYHLIVGEAPPNSQTRVAAIAAHKADPYQPLAGRIDQYPAEFLEAIDTAMNVFPQDRIQNARDWILQIDERKRAAMALKSAQTDLEIEKTVTELIEAAQRDVQGGKPTPPAAVPMQEPKAEPAKAAKPKAPVLVEDDLDFSTCELSKPAKSVPEIAARVPKEKRVSDWIARCRSKHVPYKTEKMKQEEAKLAEPAEDESKSKRTASWLILGALAGLLLWGFHILGIGEIVAQLIGIATANQPVPA